MKISIVIPNYNGEELLENNLPKVIDALLTHTGGKEIIITDDASVDNSIQIIKEIISKNKQVVIKLVESVKNQGFSSNVNQGVRSATGDIIVLLNTDVIPKKNFLQPLIEEFEDEKVFGVGCLDESIENNKTVLRGRGVGEFRRGFLIHRAGNLDSDNKTLWASGGSSAFRKSIWERLGGLDPLFNPFYWEDIDLSYRALKSGYKVLFNKKSIVIHEHEKGSIKSKYSAKKVKKIAYSNQFIFMWKNTDFGTLISSLFWLPYHLIKALHRKDIAFVFGFISAVSRIPEILTARNKSKKMFTLSDREVIIYTK